MTSITVSLRSLGNQFLRPLSSCSLQPLLGTTARPIRIAFVLHVMQVAGAEVLVKETIQRLGPFLIPLVCCLDDVGTLGIQLQRSGIEVVALARRPGRDWKVAWYLAQTLQEKGIEVVHAHQYTPFFYSALACTLMGRQRPRLIFTEHGRHYPDIVSPLRRAVNRLVLDRMADAVNAVCAFSADSLSRKDGFARNRIQVIENGIDVTRYRIAENRSDLRLRLGLVPHRRYIANIARLHPVKDQATLIRGFARAAVARDDVDLLLIGDGPERETLHHLVATLGLTDRVRFFGVRTDVPQILKAIDVFALTSVSEAASLTLLEAMASGIPVLVTAVGGNPEIVTHGRHGLLVPRGDATATGKALGQLLDDPVLASHLGRAGQAHVENLYRLEQTVAAYACLYRQLCRR